MKTVIMTTLLAAMFLTAKTALATDLVDFQTNCTTEDCDATVIRGFLNAYKNPAVAGEYVIKVHAASPQCLRLAVTTQIEDLEMDVVAPDPGVRFRDDDGNGFLRPLVKINGTQPGWYTVILHHYAGAAVDSFFAINYGLYDLNNANCANPTPPLSPSAGVSPSRKAGLKLNP